MANKINIKSDSFDEEYEVSDSENEYSEEEKELLKNVRKGRAPKQNENNEVLGFDDDDSSKDEDSGKEDFADSDIDDNDGFDNLPDSKAWGNKRKLYYNTDFVDQDYSTFNEKEEELAQQEEEEAKAIQQRLAKQLDEGDFFLDSFTDHTVNKNDGQSIFEPNKLKSDLSGIPKRQKLQLFYKDSPEFPGLIKDFDRYITECNTLLKPILKYAAEEEIELPAIDFARSRNNIIFTYCTNITFYLLLKSNRMSIKNHPVTKRLVQFRNLLTQLDEKYESVVKPQLEKLLLAIESGNKVNINMPAKPKQLNLLKSFGNTNDPMNASDSEDEATLAKNLQSDSEESQKNEEESNELDENDRRGITYQIAKNKGLTPHRKKELRNPRVKHRNKFRKALVRRKGAIRTVRNEIKRYGGEMSGIKSTVKKGIKIKT